MRENAERAERREIVCITNSPVIEENTTRVVAARETNVLLLWRAIFDRAIWRVISVKSNIGQKMTGLGIMTLNPKKI